MAPFPNRDQLLPNFALESSDGRAVQLTDFKNRRDVVLILAGTAEGAGVLDEIARRHADFRREEAEVIAVIHGGRSAAERLQRERGWPFLVLADPDGAVHHRFGAADRPAVYITDRFGEVFLACRAAEGQPLPDTSEILGWLGFVNIQCEECFPSEWPG